MLDQVTGKSGSQNLSPILVFITSVEDGRRQPWVLIIEKSVITCLHKEVSIRAKVEMSTPMLLAYYTLSCPLQLGNWPKVKQEAVMPNFKREAVDEG